MCKVVDKYLHAATIISLDPSGLFLVNQLPLPEVGSNGLLFFVPQFPLPEVESDVFRGWVGGKARDVTFSVVAVD